MKPKLDPNIFVRAAELIDSGREEFCCNALRRLCGYVQFGVKRNWPRNIPEIRFFDSLYLKDSPNAWHCAYMSVFDPSISEKVRGDLAKTHRVYALLLAATLAAHEGKK